MNFKALRKSPWRIERDTISFDVTLMTNGCASCIWKMIYLILFRIGWWIWMKCHLEALALIQRVTRVNTQRNSNRFFFSKPTWSYSLCAQCEVALTEVEKKDSLLRSANAENFRRQEEIFAWIIRPWTAINAFKRRQWKRTQTEKNSVEC